MLSNESASVRPLNGRSPLQPCKKALRKSRRLGDSFAKLEM